MLRLYRRLSVCSTACSTVRSLFCPFICSFVCSLVWSFVSRFVCVSEYVSVYPSVHLSDRLFAYWSIYMLYFFDNTTVILSVCLFVCSICRYFHSFVYLWFYLLLTIRLLYYPYIFLSTIHPSTYLSAWLSAYLSACLLLCVPVYSYFCPSISLSSFGVSVSPCLFCKSICLSVHP